MLSVHYKSADRLVPLKALLHLRVGKVASLRGCYQLGSAKEEEIRDKSPPPRNRPILLIACQFGSGERARMATATTHTESVHSSLCGIQDAREAESTGRITTFLQIPPPHSTVKVIPPPPPPPPQKKKKWFFYYDIFRKENQSISFPFPPFFFLHQKRE